MAAMVDGPGLQVPHREKNSAGKTLIEALSIII
jgi:hypothetical protein